MMLTAREMALLAGDQDFKRLCAEDPVLRELERTPIDRARSFTLLMELFRAEFFIGAVPVQPVTPAVWALLWAIDSTYTQDLREITPEDTDIFLYILSHGVRNLGCAVQELPAAASGYCEKNGLSHEEAAGELIRMINTAFAALEMLPPNPRGERIYDVDWLIQLAAVAVKVAGIPLYEVIFNTPLSVCCFCYVNAARVNDPHGFIRPRTKQETIDAVIRRMDQLGSEYLKEKNHACQR